MCYTNSQKKGTRGADMEIDFVVTWVDGNDTAWQEKKRNVGNASEFRTKTDDRDERYRDWDNLQYWFRGVEQFAPWIRKIHFVTCGHLPKWLNTEHPKLHIVKHEDFIPAEFLPTFNSHSIEWNFHRIPGLSEEFVYFNDDMYLLNKLSPEDFFVGKRPVDMLALQPDVANTDDTVMPYIYLNNAMLLAKYFKKYENMKRQPGAYFYIGYPPKYFFYNLLETAFPRFTGFYTVHGPSPLKKSTYEKLWELERDLLTEVCNHPFRHKDDVNQYVLREYQKLSGDFVPGNVQRLCSYYDIGNNNRALTETIRKQKSPIVCINDSNHEINFEKAKKELNEALEFRLWKRSSFEK